MALVRLSWMNDRNPDEKRLIDEREFGEGDVGHEVMAWAQSALKLAILTRPDGWSPLLEELPSVVEKPGKRRLAV